MQINVKGKRIKMKTERIVYSKTKTADVCTDYMRLF